MIDPRCNTPSFEHFDLPACPAAFIRYCWQAALANSSTTPLTEEQIIAGSLLHLDFAACKGMRTLNMTAAFEVFTDDGYKLTEVQRRAGMDVEHVIASGSHVLCVVFDSDAKMKAVSWLVNALQARICERCNGA